MSNTTGENEKTILLTTLPLWKTLYRKHCILVIKISIEEYVSWLYQHYLLTYTYFMEIKSKMEKQTYGLRISVEDCLKQFHTADTQLQ